MDISSGLDHTPEASGGGSDPGLATHLADLNNPHQVTPAQLNLEIGVDVQAYSAILTATTASFLTAHETKLGHISVTQAVDLDAIEARVNELDASVILKGVWDASAGTFPGAGAAQAGWSYIVSVAGTVDGVAFNVNDRIIAIVDNASTGTFAANWFKADYTDQVLTVAGKTGTVTLQVADITDMTANGRSLVSAANYAAMKTLLAITAADITDASANGRSLITAANYSAMRTLLGLVIGTNVQAWDTQLDSLASLAYAGNASKVVAVNAGATGFELITPGGGLGGSTGATDNRLLRADGTGGATAQNSAVTVDDSGNMSGVPVLTVTQGVAFPAVQNPSANANTLDDYEEGTFTPVIVGTTVAGTASYSLQDGSYTKIGNRVFFEITMTWSGHTGTGNMRIDGLPFTSAAYGACSLLLSNIVYTGDPSAQINLAATISLYTMATGAAAALMPMDAAGTMILSGHFRV